MLDGWTLSALLGLITSSFSVATVIGGCAVAVAIFLPPVVARFIPHLRTAAIYTAIAAFSYAGVAAKFYNQGLAHKQTEWREQLKNETNTGEQIRQDADGTIGDGVPVWVCNDGYNRSAKACK
jgi:hypothetical protein